MHATADEFRAVCDAVLDGVLIADVETKRILLANPAVCQMLGYREDDILSRSVDDLILPTPCPRS